MKMKDNRPIDQYSDSELKEIAAERDIWTIMAESKDKHGTAAEYALMAKLARRILEYRKASA